MKRLLAAAFAPLALSCAPAALAATLPATPANVWDVVKGAAPGDVVQLSAGDYGALNLWAIPQASPGVTIQPAPGAAVRVTTINADDSSWLIFRGFDVTMNPQTQFGFSTGRGANLVFDRMKLHQADATRLVGVGFLIRAARNVTVQNSEVYWTGSGGSVVDSDHVTVAGNEIHDINVDGILLSGATNALVTKNLLHDFHPGDGDHPDAIQFFNTSARVSGGLEIAANRVERRSGGELQGVFGEGGTEISIHDNELLGVMTNGIALAGTKGAVIDHNFVAGYPDMATQIIVRGGCDGVKIINNATQNVVNYAPAGEPHCTNVAISGNTQARAVKPGDLTALNAWKGAAAAPTSAAAAANPLQAQVDSLTEEVATLKAKIAAAEAALK